MEANVIDNTKPTTQRLAEAIREADSSQTELIERAQAGYYDDFKSKLATPIAQLIFDLQDAGLPELAQRARDGEFDATQAEAEAWFKAEGDALLKEFVAVGGEA